MEIDCPSCDEAVLIADEDMGTTVECPFCQQHFLIDEPEPPPVEKPPPILVEPAKSAQAQSGEKTFFHGLTVLVTNKRVVLGGRTYALKQITSVGRAVDYLGPKLIFGRPAWLIVFLSLLPLVLFFGLSLFFSSAVNSGEPNTILAVIMGLSLLTGLLLPLIFIIWVFAMSGQPRDWVEIGSASGKEKALLCNTGEDAQKITDAINQAIIDN